MTAPARTRAWWTATRRAAWWTATRRAAAHRRALALAAGLIILAAAWLGPLAALARHAFAAHMTLHMIVVAVAAPLVAWGVSASRFDPVIRRPGLFSPVPASIVELVVVWVWHAPVLHDAARRTTEVWRLEQASFLAAGLLLWLATLGGRPSQTPWRGLAGAGALLFTSIHMTLLGALFAVGWRPLYAHGAQPWLHPVLDQQIGGVIMLVVGGASYGVGGLMLILAVLNSEAGVARRRAGPVDAASTGGATGPGDDDGSVDGESGTHRDEGDANPRVAGVDLDTAQEEAAGQQQAGEQQGVRGGPQPSRRNTQRPDGQGEHKVNQAEQRAVRMSQGPHEAPGLVRDVEVEPYLESVQRFQHETECGKERQRPPADAQVPGHKDGVGVGLVPGSTQAGEL